MQTHRNQGICCAILNMLGNQDPELCKITSHSFLEIQSPTIKRVTNGTCKDQHSLPAHRFKLGQGKERVTQNHGYA